MDTLANISTDYDEDADIFFVRLRLERQDARPQDADHGVLIDRDRTTGEVVNVEIRDFLGHFAVTLRLLNSVFPQRSEGNEWREASRQARRTWDLVLHSWKV